MVRGASTARAARRVTGLTEPQRYTIKREFARGGMGRILLALDDAVGREVALKELLPPSGGRGSAPATPHAGAAVERFLREARVTGTLEHPNIVPVYEVGERDDGTLYYTMKFVRGRTLADRLRDINDDPGETAAQKLTARLKLLDHFVDICNAVAYAHSKGVVHRDLKPLNAMLGEFGETVLIDWGLAKVEGPEGGDSEDRHSSESRNPSTASATAQPGIPNPQSNGVISQLTLDGSVLGTPAYMPPEQATGDLAQVDARSDVYSLGAILYEILAGVAPYAGTSAQAVLNKVLQGPPDPVERHLDSDVRKLLPAELVAVVNKAMARDKAARFATAKELADDVQAFRDGRTLASYSYSFAEHLKRFVSRNKAAVVTGLLAFIMLVGGGIYSYLDIVAQKRETERHYAAAVKAEGEASSERDAARAAEAETAKQRDAARAALTQARANMAQACYERALTALDANNSNEACAFAAESLALGGPEAARELIVNHPPSVVMSAIHMDEYLNSLAYSPDGRWVTAACADGSIALAKHRGGGGWWQKKVHGAWASCAVFTPDGQTIASAGYDRAIRLWDRETSADIGVLTGHTEGILSLAVAPDNDTLASASLDGTVRLWSISQKKELANLQHHRGEAVYSVAIDPDGEWLVSGDERGRVFFVDLALREPKAVIAAHEAPINSLAFDPNGARLLTGAGSRNHADNRAAIWNLYDIDMSGGSIDMLNRMGVIDATSPAAWIDGQESRMVRVCFGPVERLSGQALAFAASEDGTVRIARWGKLAHEISMPGRRFTAMAVSPDGTTLMTADFGQEAGSGGSLKRWFIGEGGEPGAMREPYGSATTALAWDAGNQLAQATAGVAAGGQFVIWNAATGRAISHGARDYAGVYAAAWSPDGKRLLSAGVAGYLDGIEPVPEDVHASGLPERSPIFAAAWRPDGKQAAAARNDGTLDIYDAGTDASSGKIARSMKTGLTELRAVAYSRAGDLLATGGKSGIAVYDAAGEKLLGRAELGPLGYCYSLVFSADGRRLFAGGVTSVIEIYDVSGLAAGAREPVDLKEAGKLEGHSHIVGGLALSPDGAWLASASQDGSAAVWDMESGKRLVTLRGARVWATAVAFSPDGKELAVGWRNGEVRRFSLAPLSMSPVVLYDHVAASTLIGVTDLAARGARRFLELPPRSSGKPGDVQPVGWGIDAVLPGYDVKWHDKFEGYRYFPMSDLSGKPARQPIPPREKDPATGDYIGEPTGRIDYERWLKDGKPGGDE